MYGLFCNPKIMYGILEFPLNPAGQYVVGMKDTKSACCGFGRLNGWGPCVEAFHTNVCVNRTDYLFWDWFNPTEKASELVAKTLFEGGTEFVFPMNFSQLIN